MHHKDYGRYAIFGASGSGKSTRAKQLLKELSAEAGGERVVIFDVLHEYSGAVVSNVLDMVKAIKKGWHKGFRIVYQPSRMASKEDELNAIASILFEVQAPYKAGAWDRPIFLMVEEMSLCYSVLQRPPERDQFGELCATGRHYGLFPIGISQRPAETGNKFRGNVSKVYAFRQANHADLQFFRSQYGPEIANQLPDLADHEHLCIERGQAEKAKNTL